MNSENIITTVGTLLIMIIAQLTGIDVTINEISHKKEVNSDRSVEHFYVTHIVDGDTFDIDSGERVRMIGIDTPERGDEYFDEAKEYLTHLIDGKLVYLVKDISERDRYGRILRHVYIDDLWINEIMIKNGYAHAVTFPPDVMHVDIFLEAEREAREETKGLWSE